MGHVVPSWGKMPAPKTKAPEGYPIRRGIMFFKDTGKCPSCQEPKHHGKCL